MARLAGPIGSHGVGGRSAARDTVAFIVFERGGRTDCTVVRRLGGATVAVGVTCSAGVVAVGVEEVCKTCLLAVAVV